MSKIPVFLLVQVLMPVLVLPVAGSPAQVHAQSDSPCAVYIGVLQDDPRAPGRYVPRMTTSQANWYAKNGAKQYPGLCLSLEKARYLILWSVSTQTRTTHMTETRSVNATTSTFGSESGTFHVYGSLSARGSYSGTSWSSSSTTVSYQESVPVTIASDHCSVYVLRSVGPTIWDDIRSKIPEPLAIFSTETRGPNRVKDSEATSLAANTGLLLGTTISHAVTREPTSHALDAALKFISSQPFAMVPLRQATSFQVSGDTPRSVKTEFPKVWKSTSCPDRYTVRFDGEFVYAELIPPDALRPWIMYINLDARRSDKLYVGTIHYAASCRATSCPFEDQIEFNSITPTRIEGTMLTYPMDAKLNCNLCQFTKPKQIITFVWIPEQ